MEPLPGFDALRSGTREWDLTPTWPRLWSRGPKTASSVWTVCAGGRLVFVVASAGFGEVRHSIAAMEVGWLAVKMFFALSGFLVGRLILERMTCENFFVVFYVRRFCRTLPVYFFCVLLVYLCMHLLGSPQWMDVGNEFPLWSYLTFTQNFFMISTDSVGPRWLAPTWTLSVEEQFYIFAPLLFVFVSRRGLPYFLGGAAVLALLFRVAADSKAACSRP